MKFKLVLIFVVVMLLSACGNFPVHQRDWDIAEKLCSNNGGVDYVYSGGACGCINGATFPAYIK